VAASDFSSAFVQARSTLVTKQSWQSSRGGHGLRPYLYQKTLVVKVAWALKRGKWPQKRGDLGHNIPRNGPISPKNGPNFKIIQNNILIARSKILEQGNLLSQTSPFIYLFTTRTPPPLFPVSHRKLSVNVRPALIFDNVNTGTWYGNQQSTIHNAHGACCIAFFALQTDIYATWLYKETRLGTVTEQRKAETIAYNAASLCCEALALIRY
jgi:hypothetical protein